MEPALSEETLTPMWVSLLRDLNERFPRWVVMKNVRSALTGPGDVDSVAPEEDWPGIKDVFCRWAEDHELGPVIVCLHAPFLMHLMALTDRRPEFFELDVNRRKIFLGSTLFRPDDLGLLIVLDELGFRRLRSGTDGLLKLVQNGTSRDGHPKPEGLRVKRIPELLREDWPGVERAAALFGPGRRAVLRAARAVADGRWDRRAALAVEGWSLLRAVGEPDAVFARARFRLNKRRCPVLVRVFDHGRRQPEDRAAWLATVARDHEVIATAVTGATR
jgi:hypothetical protein